MQNDQSFPVTSVGEIKIYDYDPDISTHPIPFHLRAIPEQPKNRMDKYLIRFEQLLNKFFRSLMMLACLLLAGLMFAQVMMRYVLDLPFSGIEEVSILLAVWIYFLGMGYATREREHIHGGIVNLLVKDHKKMAYIRLFGSVTCMIAACLFGYFAYEYALTEIDRGRVSANLRWPRGMWTASMILGFAMMTGYFLLEAINEYRGLRKTAQRESRSSNQKKQHQLKQKLDRNEV